VLLGLSEAGPHRVHKVCIKGNHHRPAQGGAVWDLCALQLAQGDPEQVRAVLEQIIEH